MEFPPGLIRVERALAALLLAGVAAVAVLEARSPLAGAARAGRPWICRVSLEPTPAPGEGAIVYSASGSSAIWLGTAPADFAEGAPVLSFSLPPGAHAEPALALEDAVRPRTLRGWLRALRPPSFGRALLLLDLARGPTRPAYLPEDPADREAFVAQVMGMQQPPPRREPITVEVLNASNEKGLAYDVTKFLRSKGADVVHYGNVGGPASSQTIVYDRTGRFGNAEWVRDRLGCPAAAMTQISAKSLVDVTVVLADDCKP